MKHKYSTYLIVIILGIALFGTVVGNLQSGDIDEVCNQDNSTLFRWLGEWKCANLMDASFNLTVNNVTIYNNYTSNSDMIDGRQYENAWNSTYNVSYNGALNNASYLSTFNSSYVTQYTNVTFNRVDVNTTADFGTPYFIALKSGNAVLNISDYNNGGNHEPMFYADGGHSGGTALLFANKNAFFRILPFSDGYTYFQGSGGSVAFSGLNGVQGTSARFDFVNTYITGQLGVGGVTPQANLDVARGTSASGTAVLHGTTYTTNINYGANEDWYLRAGKSGGTIFMNDVGTGDVTMCQGGGTVNIGNGAGGSWSPTDSVVDIFAPAKFVDIDSNVGGEWGMKFRGYDGSNFIPIFLFTADGTTGQIRMGSNHSAYYPTIYSGNKEVMRFTTDGNVSIGQTLATVKLDINGTLKVNGGSPNQAICWKSDGKTLGYCLTVVNASGGCTCN